MSKPHYVIAGYGDEVAAHAAVEAVIAADCPMDRISVLGRLTVEGDDVLGLVHPGVGQRMEVWGANGAFWGARLGGAARPPRAPAAGPWRGPQGPSHRPR